MANSMVRQGRCQICGARAEVLAVHYRQNTGMLVMRQTRKLECDLCRRCSSQAFRRMSLHTLVLGWWGTISFFVTPFYLIGNLICFVRTLGLRSSDASAKSRLDDQSEYALALLATKDEQTVVEVLAKSAGVDEADARAFVQGLRRSA